MLAIVDSGTALSVWKLGVQVTLKDSSMAAPVMTRPCKNVRVYFSCMPCRCNFGMSRISHMKKLRTKPYAHPHI
jgi:hypothetical protein